MKKNLTILFLLISSLAFSQEEDIAMSEHIFISTAKKKVNIYDINRKSIFTLLGKPKKRKKEMSETDGLLTVYTYPGGEIYFDENGSLNSIEIKGIGWAIILKSKNKPEKSFSLNSTSKEFYTYFQKSWDGKDSNRTDIYLKSKSGKMEPYCWVVFSTSNGYVSSIIYAFNNY